MKVDLDREKIKPSIASGLVRVPCTRSLPFYNKGSLFLFHRVRYVTLTYRDGAFSHAYAGFWCGNSGFLCGGARLVDVPPAGVPHCAFCEAKVLRAGAPSSATLAGHPVHLTYKRK